MKGGLRQTIFALPYCPFFLMRPKLQKRSELKLDGRIILGAKRRRRTSAAKFEASVEQSHLRSNVGFEIYKNDFII